MNYASQLAEEGTHISTLKETSVLNPPVFFYCTHVLSWPGLVHRLWQSWLSFTFLDFPISLKHKASASKAWSKRPVFKTKYQYYNHVPNPNNIKVKPSWWSPPQLQLPKSPFSKTTSTLTLFSRSGGCRVLKNLNEYKSLSISVPRAALGGPGCDW